MNEFRQLLGNRLFWLTGAGGFGFAFIISMIGGNLLETSLRRGIAGFFVILVAFAVVRLWISTFVTPQATEIRKELEVSQAVTKFDVSLPAESPDFPPDPSDFQPWVLHGNGEELTDNQVQNFVDAIRTIQK